VEAGSEEAGLPQACEETKLHIDTALEETIFSFSAIPPQPPERREQRRYMTILRVGSIFVGDKRELCLIRNISAGGLMAHVYSPLEVGQPVGVELKTNQRIAGSVSWLQDNNAGITFAEQIDVEEMLAGHSVLENGWRPRLPRVEIDCLATLRVGASLYGVSTRDISQGGIKIETDEPLEEGQDVVLTLEGFRPVVGVVRWYQDGICGIAFNQVIPFRELMSWLRER
jgi:Tfp pilus assembly protein PilZ